MSSRNCPTNRLVHRARAERDRTDATKALGSVSKIVANGNKVVFDESGSFIENKRSRERLWMREDNGVYVLDVYVAPPDCHEKKRDFHRQGIR